MTVAELIDKLLQEEPMARCVTETPVYQEMDDANDMHLVSAVASEPGVVIISAYEPDAEAF